MLGQGLRLVGIGIAAGLLAAAVLTRLLERLLFEIEPLDPWTFSTAPFVVIAVAIVALYVPARRSMRIAPVEALRAR